MESCKRPRSFCGEGRRRLLLHVPDRRLLRQRPRRRRPFPWTSLKGYLVNWEYLGGTMPTLPDWIVPKLNEIRKSMGLPDAAPDVNAFGYCFERGEGQRQSLSHVLFNRCPRSPQRREHLERTCLHRNDGECRPRQQRRLGRQGLRNNQRLRPRPEFQCLPTDWGHCYYKFNAIDPSAIITESGEHWLIYGSWHSGIAAVKLDPSTGKTAAELGNPFGNTADIAPYGKLIATRQKGNRWQGSEGRRWYIATAIIIFSSPTTSLHMPTTPVWCARRISKAYLDINGTDVTNNGGTALPVVTHPYKFNNSPAGRDSPIAPSSTTERATGFMPRRLVSPTTTMATPTATPS